MSVALGGAALLFAAWLFGRGCRATGSDVLRRRAPLLSAVLPGLALATAAAAATHAASFVGALLGIAAAATHASRAPPPGPEPTAPAGPAATSAAGMLGRALVVVAAGAVLAERGAHGVGRILAGSAPVAGAVVAAAVSVVPSFASRAIARWVGGRAARPARPGPAGATGAAAARIDEARSGPST
jgi:hypothetical protein